MGPSDTKELSMRVLIKDYVGIVLRSSQFIAKIAIPLVRTIKNQNENSHETCTGMKNSTVGHSPLEGSRGLSNSIYTSL